MFTASSPVAGATACLNSTIFHSFAGVVSSGQQYGARGNIRDRPINLCTTASDDDSAASAWVMLAGNGASEYAQFGYWRADFQPWIRFVEFHTGVTWQRILFSSPAFSNGAVRQYQVSYVSSDQRIHFYLGGVQQYLTPWSPNSQWSTPWTTQFLAETWDRGDDIPGTSAARTRFDVVASQKCAGCSFTNLTNVTTVATQTFYKFQWVASPYVFDVWTQR